MTNITLDELKELGWHETKHYYAGQHILARDNERCLYDSKHKEITLSYFRDEVVSRHFVPEVLTPNRTIQYKEKGYGQYESMLGCGASDVDTQKRLQ